MNDEQMQSLLDAWYRNREIPRPKVQTSVAEVMASVPRTRQRGRWWPLPAFERSVSTFPSRELVPVPIPATIGPTPARGFTMSSALKFMVASVIVALFGGFVLAGLFTAQQGDERGPAAVTESPSPMTSEALLSGMDTEEVEPGVFRVTNDGVRDLRYSGGTGFMVDVTPDGSVWLSTDDGKRGLFRLGEERVFEEVEGFFSSFREVAPDGSLWAIDWDWDFSRGGIFSFDGEGWTVRATTTDPLYALAVGPDRTVWVLAEDDDKRCPDTEDDDCSGTVLLRLEDDGSLTTIEDWSDVFDGDAALDQLAVSPDGDVWLVGTPRSHLLRFDGEGWDAIPSPERWNPGGRGPYRYLDVGPDGAVWLKADTTGGLARFEDPGWTTFTQADGVEPWREPWGSPGSSTRELLNVAADDSVWVNGGPTDEGCGATYFDGTTWTSYLVGFCIEDFAVAPDGSVWVGADGRAGRLDLYVITPEAVAGTE
jgi:hypothetical protein